MSYQTIKRGIDKLEQRINGSQNEPQKITVSFIVDGEDDHSTDLPGQIIHVFGGADAGVYRADGKGNRKLIRKGQK